MDKKRLLDRYIYAKDNLNGYFDMKNPSFKQKTYKKLQNEVKQLKELLNEHNISEKEIQSREDELKDEGELFN